MAGDAIPPSDHDHDPKVVGATPAHLVLRWSHRVFSDLKRWALGTFHGLRRAHLGRYLDEFVFRWNRHRHTATALDTLLVIGAPATRRLTATSSNNAPDHGGRTTPPPAPRSASIGDRNISPPACLTAPKINFPPERRKPINILWDRNQGESLFRDLRRSHRGKRHCPFTHALDRATRGCMYPLASHARGSDTPLGSRRSMVPCATIRIVAHRSQVSA